MNKREFTDAVKEVTRITRKKTVAPATGFVAARIRGAVPLSILERTFADCI